MLKLGGWPRLTWGRVGSAAEATTREGRGARSGDGARTTRNEGKKTTDCRGARRRGLAFGLTARAGTHGRPTSAPPEPEFGGGNDA